MVACGDDSDTASGAGSGDSPDIVVTTNILGDVVTEVVGADNAEIETIMPPGVDPHEFEPSARQAEAMMDTDLLVVNGAGFEEGLHSLIDQAEAAGVEVFTFADHVSLIEGDDEDGHEHEHEDEGAEEDRDDAAEHHDHGPEDPHVWTDPARMVGAVQAFGDTVTTLDGIDAAAVEDRATSYLGELEALDDEIETLVADVPEERRVLVTNHEVFGYFADRYGFEIVGTVIPSASTLADPSSRELEDLEDVVRDHQMPAIFAETTADADLAARLADSVGDVEVVELHSESLGEPGSGAESYADMMRTNASLIVDALA